MEDDPPPMDCEPVRVKTDSGFECAAEFFKWSCTGMCARLQFLIDIRMWDRTDGATCVASESPAVPCTRYV